MLIPASLPLDSLSAPMQNPAMSDKATSIMNISSYPDKIFGIFKEINFSVYVETGPLTALRLCGDRVDSNRILNINSSA